MTGRRRAALTERTLDQLSRRRPLGDLESRCLEAAIVEQTDPRLARNGRVMPRRFNGAPTPHHEGD